MVDYDSDASNGSDISHGNNDEVMSVEWRAGDDDDGKMIIIGSDGL